ncbi:hypothetical protein M0811_06437 [Anaeramoeba ignava]|uniref:Uncharacterized protein n=1 Tax=Anaeramoeba ignava TaxID=1746090 RepID=A0A9Q0RDR4_ANAIG|nr:hypothetical protein M0811_06437 [Anaeramoeba ignava]
MKKRKIFLISSPFATIGNNYEQGKVYIYENNGTNWNQKQILIANDGEEDEEFGKRKVYIFQNNGTFYNLKQILIANDGKEYHEFGSSVAISNDSSFLFISALQANVGNNSNQGKVYIFQNNGIIWNQYQILIANDGKSSDRFGFSISISSDSSFIVVGVPYAKIGDNSLQGKAYIFQNNGTFWNQKEILIANDGETNDEFGSSVSISENYCLIGSPNSNFGDIFEQGKVYIFQNNGTIFLKLIFYFELFFFLFSFECYWNQINSTLNDIEYQINYQNEIENWELIQSPILNQNVLYQIFNSSIYSNISGNVDYSIQIKICNISSNQINLTTKN